MPLPPLLNGYRGRGLALVAALTLVQAAAAGAAAFATRSLFQAMHEGAALPLGALVALVCSGGIIAAARIAARQVGERIGQDYARRIRAALFDHAARMPAAAVAQRRSGYMSLRFVGDMTAFRNWLGLGLPRLIAAVLLIPAALGVLWALDPVLAQVVLPVVAVTLALTALGGLRLIPLQRRLRLRRARIAAEMAERMPLAPRLDRLGRRPKELAQLDRRTDAMVAAALRHRRAAETLKALPDLAAGLAAALVILAGHRGGLDTASIAGALAALGLLVSPLRDLGGVWNHRAAFRAAQVKAEAALSRGQRDMYRAGKSLPKGPVDILFDGVTLPSGAVLNHHVKAGDRASLPICELDGGAVSDMLLGLDAPATGRILLSGVDLRDLSRGSLRRSVLRIGPSCEVLQGSLRRVLLMGCSAHPDDAVLETLAQETGLAPLLKRLGGLDGTVREGGRNLTASERRAISILRARLQRPRLVVLEPDCGLNGATGVQAALGRRRITILQAWAGQAQMGSAA